MSEADRTGPRTDDSHESGDDEGGGIFTRLKSLFGRAGDTQDFSIELDDRQREAARRLPRARREMIERVIAFDEKRVEDVMAPRADIVAVDIETPLDELIKAFADAGHSRMPVYRGDLDDPVGMAHIKDVVAVIADPAAAGPGDGPILKKLRRDVLYVPPSMRITDLLLRMQASRIHMAIVIDEFGGTDGLVTIEDLVEEIVGDINDEHDDEEEATIISRPGGGWDADGRVEFDEFAEATGVVLDSEDDEVDTLGGLVFSLAGRVPQRGEVLSHPSGYDFEVVEADARKVRKLRIRKTPVATPDDAPQKAAE
ncbi:MAG: hemolysin family protein [Parvularculaceae bacterium]